MRHDGRAAVELRYRAQVDRKSKLDVLTLPQTEIRGLDEYPGRAEIHGLAELSFSTRRGDVHDGPGPMPGVQAAFQDGVLVDFVVIRGERGSPACIMPSGGAACASD
jgi:hypothetical protein